MAVIIQVRRDTASNWTTNNPVLANGELGYETDTKKVKIGDGTTAWATLPYATAGGDSFLSLADTLNAYTGYAGQYVKVKATEDGLEFNTIAAADLPMGIDATKIGTGVVDNTEFGYLDGVTSAIQTQIDTANAAMLRKDGTVALAGNWSAGGYDISDLGTLTANEGKDIKVEMAVPTGVSAALSAAGTLNGTYYYKVTALDGVGETLPSAEVSGTVDGGTTNGTITVSWTAVTGAAKYRVWRGTAAAGENEYYETTATSLADDGSLTFTSGTLPAATTAYLHKVDTSSFYANPSLAYFAGRAAILTSLSIGTTTQNNAIYIETAVPAVRLVDTDDSSHFSIFGYNDVGQFLIVSDYSKTLGTGSVVLRASNGNAKLTASSNFGLGTATPGGGTTVGTSVLSIADGTAPAGGVSGQSSLYSSSGELYAFDSGGNATLLSPHKFELFEPDPTYELPFSYYSENRFIGKKVNVDMYGAIRALEKLTGKQFIYIEDLPPKETIDWDENEKKQKAKRDKEIKEWKKRKAKIEKTAKPDELEDRLKELGEQPKPYVKRTPPKWIAERMKRPK